MPEENKNVKWTIFIWAMGFILIAFGFVFNTMASLNGKVDISTKDMTDMKGDVREIKTNVAWIMKIMQEGQQLKQGK